MSNQYTFITIFNLKDDVSKQKFLDFCHGKNGIGKTKSYQGCLSLDLYSSKKDKLKYIMIQNWSSVNEKKQYLDMRDKEGTHAFLQTLMATPLNIDLIKSVQSAKL